MIKIAIYSRKSRETDTGDSIENQIVLCKEYCSRNYIGEEIEYSVYEDEGFSGGNTNRPKFQELMKDIKDKKINKLICYRLDRISRNVADFSSTLELLQSNNCDFISIKEQFDTSTPMGRAMIYIASVFAQLERETIAERVRDNMIQMAKNGQWLGGTPPIGFDVERIKYLDEGLKERTMCKLIPIDEELEKIQYIYNIYLKERSISKVVNSLLIQGIKSKSGKTLQSISVIRILRNPMYVKSSPEVHKYLTEREINVYGSPNGNGYITYGKSKSGTVRVKNDKDKWIYAVSRHEGIIDSDTWLEVQRILDSNKDKQFKRTGTGTNNPALLSGLFKCSKCGSNMVVRKSADRYYYICSGKINKIENLCDCKNVRVDELDSLVISTLNTYSKDLLIAELPNVIKLNDTESLNNNSANIEKELKSKKEMLSSLIKRIALAPDDSVAQALMDEVAKYNKEIDSLQNSLNEISDNSERKKIDIENMNLFIDSLKNFCKNIKLVNDVVTRRSLIQSIVKKITWNDESYEADIELLEDISEGMKKK